MPGTQRFFPNRRNLIAEAVAAAGYVRAIENAVLRRPKARTGSASLAITGAYSGATEATYEFEVLDADPSDSPEISQPVFTGKGNGTLGDIAFTPGTLVAQTFSAELNDLGMPLRAASVELYGNNIVARTSGTGGNTFTLAVDRSALVHTLQSYSLLDDLPAGTESIEGAAYDWDTKLLQGDGTIPTDAHRISFGDNTNDIYLTYKTYINGKLEYHFIPAIRQTVPKGTRVNFVTGSYAVKLYDGATLQETFTPVVTLYDFLNLVKTESALITVDSIVAYDRTPTGSASQEFPLNTDAYVQSNTGEGSEYAKGFTNVSIDAGAPTELVIATCIAATPKDDSAAGLGNELWNVDGSVSGSIATRIVSGTPVNAGFYDFTIPQKVPPGFQQVRRGEFQLARIEYVDRVTTGANAEPPAPPICPDSLTLGVNAVEQQITLTYAKRPKANPDCDCSTMPGASFNPECLGLDSIDNGGSNLAYSADAITRLKDLYDWLADTVEDNSGYRAGQAGAYTSILNTDNGGGFGVDTVAGVMDPFIANPLDRSASRIYRISADGIEYQDVQAPALLGYVKQSLLKIVETYERTLAIIDKTSGTLKTDGFTAWDAAFTKLQSDVSTYLTGAATAQTEDVVVEADVTSNTWVLVYTPAGDTTKKARPAVEIPVGGTEAYYGFVLASTAAGGTATVYRWGTMDMKVLQDSNCATFMLPIVGASVAASKYCPGLTGQYSEVSGSPQFSIAGAPTAYVIAPGANSAATHKLYIPRQLDANAGLQLVPERYTTRLQYALISAGVSPLGKSDASTDGGDGCWQDSNDEYYWLVEGSEGGGYAPAFSNVPYVSSKYRSGQVVDGVLVPQSKGYFSTKEFAFVINVKCPADLKEGDQVVLTIGNAAYPSTYQVGDRLILEVVAAQNLALSGGSNGDNVQTWNVTGSVAGPLPSYAYNPGAPVAYNSGNGLEFLITPGVIDFDKGDKFEFTVEGGHFRWRKVVDGVAGAWSASTAIDTTVNVLSDGLSYQWQLGATPSFVDGDIFEFLALQPYAITNLQRPGFEQWEWGNVAGPSQVWDLGSTQAISAIAFAYHTLPNDAGVTVSFSNISAGGPWSNAKTLNVQKDAFYTLFEDSPVNARYVRLVLTGAANAAIGWFFVGEALAFENSAEVTIKRQYQMQQAGTDFNPAASYRGRGVGSEVRWPEGHLTEDDLGYLCEMLDGLKAEGNEALMFVPQYTRPDCYMVQVLANEVEISDLYFFQPDEAVARRMSATIPFAPIYFQ